MISLQQTGKGWKLNMHFSFAAKISCTELIGRQTKTKVTQSEIMFIKIASISQARNSVVTYQQQRNKSLQYCTVPQGNLGRQTKWTLGHLSVYEKIIIISFE